MFPAIREQSSNIGCEHLKQTNSWYFLVYLFTWYICEINTEPQKVHITTGNLLALTRWTWNRVFCFNFPRLVLHQDKWEWERENQGNSWCVCNNIWCIIYHALYIVCYYTYYGQSLDSMMRVEGRQVYSLAKGETIVKLWTLGKFIHLIKCVNLDSSLWFCYIRTAPCWINVTSACPNGTIMMP